MIQVKITRVFGAYINFEKDQVREFTDAEALRYAGQVERIDSDSGTFLDRSITKAKKPRRKKG